jgi:2-phosphosulfolactate phosphatase
VRVRVGLTPAEPTAGTVAVVIDVLRATSTICAALANGYERVICAGEVDEARALAAGRDDSALAGERGNVRPEGFDFGNSPRELAAGAPSRPTLVLTTTNGTRLLLAAASRCETVLVGSLLNFDAVVAAVRASGAPDVAILCAGVEGAFAIDDAYVAGAFAAAVGGDPDDAAVAAVRLAGAFASDEDGIAGGVSAANIRAVGLDADIPWCARRSVLDVAPRIIGRTETTVEIAAG